ncbi:MAG TPA: tetratricopeptide repeat protein [Cyclobacteriaceae bacterium]|nr:tetratricopeptide repeat protein [Cyclobacteriaceae bacterium]
MLKTRIILVSVSILVVWLLFQLPKSVVSNEEEMGSDSTASAAAHNEASPELKSSIANLRSAREASTEQEKSAIFADSLADQYKLAGKFDSAAYFAGEAASFFNTPESWIRAGDKYYEAYTFALDAARQGEMAAKAQEFYGKVLASDPDNLDVKTRLAMTYLSSENPMQGISMLREVLATDPENREALFNMGMLAIQSGQFDLAVGRFETLIRVDSTHLQGQLLLGVALLNAGEREKARMQFEKVKTMDQDPAVQAEVDSYLKDLK